MSVVYTSEEPETNFTSLEFVEQHPGQIVEGENPQTNFTLNLSVTFKKLLVRCLNNIELGELTLIDTSSNASSHHFGNPGTYKQATIIVNSPKFYQMLFSGGALSAAEAYICGYWDSPNLTDAMQVLARNSKIIPSMDRGAARLLRPLRSMFNWFRRNTKSGSKKNISAHYDLSNDFFQLMLDPTMTYSSGVFLNPQSSMEEASYEKYDRICRKLKLSSSDHVLEIGTGWGGFAMHAAKNYGCKITTTTISDQQYLYAQDRFQQEKLQSQVNLLKEDYRDLNGTYDKIVSIEMIEAVGEKYLPQFFTKCNDLLTDHGVMALQSITIAEQHYDVYRKTMDFIQHYIFPGGFLPSYEKLARCIKNDSNMRILHVEDFGLHYAKTLAIWRENFWNHIEAIQKLGFDERFIRTWHYYLCYCEAGFLEREIGVSQLVFAKPKATLDPLMSI